MTQRKTTMRPDRRRFLEESAGGLGSLALGAVAGVSTLGAAEALAETAAVGGGANDRLQLGIVGVGSRGGSLMAWANKLAATSNVRFTAVCDLWRRRRETAAARVAEWNGAPPAVCRTPAELFDRPDVDAVLIATADFQHGWLAAQAAAAGKDVYIETPFGCDFDQARAAAGALKASGRVVQFGNQARGDDRYAAAARFVRAGRLGQIQYVEIAEPVCQQRWRVPNAETLVQPGDVDWREYLAYLPKSLPFDARHYVEFRLFEPFSTGPFSQWLGPRLDLVNLVLGSTPAAATATGLTSLWHDGRTTPDVVQAALEYPGGVLCAYHTRMGNSLNGRGITVYGTCGTLEVDNGVAYGNGGQGLAIEGERLPSGGTVYRLDAGRVLRGKAEGGVPLPREPSVDYLAHFFDWVRTRKASRPAVGGLEAAFGETLSSCLAHQAYRRGRRMTIDPAGGNLRPASEAAPDTV
ncbi:MAG: Gfo/Idh/MocA family protein [Planctomycetia bacterium]